MLRLIGVEPITVGTEIRSSVQLSYKRYKKKLVNLFVENVENFVYIGFCFLKFILVFKDLG